MTVGFEDDVVMLPRAQVRFPVELRAPPEMRVEDPSTWPRVEGRLEYVAGRLLYMPPCGDVQQDVAMDVAHVLRAWVELHQAYVVGGNEAGMLLAGEARGADAAIWRRADAGTRTGGFRRVAPVLAVEIAGRDEDEGDLRAKARWYLEHGVGVVWLVLPETREVVVLEPGGDRRFGRSDRLPSHAGLPGLEPAVEGLFAQLDAGGAPGRTSG